MASISKSINENGEISYRIRVFCGIAPDGRQLFRSETWKPDPAMNAKQADREANMHAALLEAQIAEEKKQGVSFKRVKFKQLAEEWFDMVEQTGEMKKSSIIRLRTCSEKVYRAFGDRYVDDITYRMIQQFILALANDKKNSRSGKGMASKTQRHYITFISDVMRYAKQCGLVKENPCKDVSVVKREPAERTPYTLEEERALLDLMYLQQVPLKYQVMYRFFIYCGMRRGEVLGLEWSDIDLENGVFHINHTSNYQNSKTGVYSSTPKTKSSRRSLQLPEELSKMLYRYKLEQYTARLIYDEEWKDSDQLFTSENGSPMNPNTAYNWLRSFCNKNGLPFKGLHNFRHAFASEVIASQQVDIHTVSSILGHSQVSTTLNIYAHDVQSARASAMNCVYDLIQEKKRHA